MGSLLQSQREPGDGLALVLQNGQIELVETVVGGGGGGFTPIQLTATFVQPAVGSAVVASVNSTLGAVVGSGAIVGGTAGAYVISAIGVGTLTLINLGSSGLVVNAAPTTVIPNGSSLVFDGPAIQFLTGLDLTYTVSSGYQVTATVTSIGQGGPDGTIQVFYNNLQFGPAEAAPTISVATTAAAVAEDLSIVGQPTTFVGGTNGSINLDLPAPPSG